MMPLTAQRRALVAAVHRCTTTTCAPLIARPRAPSWHRPRGSATMSASATQAGGEDVHPRAAAVLTYWCVHAGRWTMTAWATMHCTGGLTGSFPCRRGHPGQPCCCASSSWGACNGARRARWWLDGRIYPQGGVFLREAGLCARVCPLEPSNACTCRGSVGLLVIEAESAPHASSNRHALGRAHVRCGCAGSGRSGRPGPRPTTRRTRAGSGSWGALRWTRWVGGWRWGRGGWVGLMKGR